MKHCPRCQKARAKLAGHAIGVMATVAKVMGRKPQEEKIHTGSIPVDPDTVSTPVQHRLSRHR